MRRLPTSLALWAEYLACTPQFDAVQTLYAEIGFLQAREFQIRRLVEALGFQFQSGAPPRLRFWKHAFWEDLYSWWLMWTFSPASLHGRHFTQMAHCELWLSRATLVKRYSTMK